MTIELTAAQTIHPLRVPRIDSLRDLNFEAKKGTQTEKNTYLPGQKKSRTAKIDMNVVFCF